MEKFKYGIMVINPNEPLENGDYEVLHFVGYWEKPGVYDFEHITEEIRTDPEFGLVEIADQLVCVPATQDCVDYYNEVCKTDGAFDIDEPTQN
jgi:hypothetical protein